MKWHSNRLATNSSGFGALDADGFGASYAPPSQQHLVVESRTDDRWRVALCTTLDDLDTALDAAKSLRNERGIDEVCLTLETTGTNGREVRREIIRLGHHDTITPSDTDTEEEPAEHCQPDLFEGNGSEEADDPALDAILPAIKMPDYEVDEAVLDALRPRPALNTLERMQEDTVAAPVTPSRPVYGTDDAPTEAEARAAARALVSSLYGLHSEVDEEHAAETGPASAREDVIDLSDVLPMSDDVRRRDQQEADRSAAEAAAVAAMDDSNWVHDVEEASHRRFAGSGRLEADEECEDAAERLARPLIGDNSGVASKAFIVAGTLAMMVLGGAIAELLTLNVTSPAMADQMTVSDTLRP